MRRSGTGGRDGFTPLWPCLLGLCGWACGDSVVVAREFSLISAAVESRDAGSDADEHNAGPHFNFGQGGTGPQQPHPAPHSGAGGSQSVAPHSNKDDGDGNGGTGGRDGTSGVPKHP
ncbi:MAG TPA: hypothetical protein VJU61_21665 [Polyangiaceae bacterium]|nr:hypothetical protein [Polyangiaceae bacterium]